MIEIAPYQTIKIPGWKTHCPECGGKLLVDINGWDTDGIPWNNQIFIRCSREDKIRHHYANTGEWNHVVRRVKAWVGMNVRIVKSLETGV